MRPIDLFRTAAALACCAAAAGSVVSSLHAAGPISSHGRYSFARLGSPTVVLRGPAAERGETVTFVLPAGASARRGSFYIVDLHARVRIAPDSPPGNVYLMAESGGYGSAQIAFTVSGKGRAVEWTSVGAINGVEHHRSTSRTIDVRFSNYLPYKGIHPGRNTLAVFVRSFGARIAAATIYSDSAIEYVGSGPGRLVARASVNHPRVKVGSPVVATVQVRNAGGSPVHKIRVSWMLIGVTLTPATKRAVSFRALRPGEQQFESFRFTARTSGLSQIAFLVSSSANQTATQVAVAVSRTAAAAPPAPGAAAASANGKSGSAAWTAAGAAAAVAAVGAVSAILFARRRGKRSGR